jgi:hypothetical protein
MKEQSPYRVNDEENDNLRKNDSSIKPGKTCMVVPWVSRFQKKKKKKKKKKLSMFQIAVIKVLDFSSFFSKIDVTFKIIIKFVIDQY